MVITKKLTASGQRKISHKKPGMRKKAPRTAPFCLRVKAKTLGEFRERAIKNNQTLGECLEQMLEQLRTPAQ